MAIIYNVGANLARVCFTLLSRWTVEGKEAVPPRGRLLIVCNHQSNADPPVVAASMPRRVYFMGKEGLFAGPILSALLKACGVYPVNRSGHDYTALQWGLHLLEQDMALVMFPEGARNPGRMKRATRGTAYLAIKTQAPILPVAITGTENVRGMIRVPAPLCRMHVRIGQPFTLPMITGQISRPVLDHLTSMIMGRVADLLPPSYRGIYSRDPEIPT